MITDTLVQSEAADGGSLVSLLPFSTCHVVWGEQAHLPGVYWFVACAAVRKWIASMKSPSDFTPLWKWMRCIQTYHTNTRLLSLLSSPSCGGCRRCCRGSRIIWSLRRTAIEKQEPSHTVYMCCSHWDLIKKKKNSPLHPKQTFHSWILTSQTTSQPHQQHVIRGSRTRRGGGKTFAA